MLPDQYRCYRWMVVLVSGLKDRQCRSGVSLQKIVDFVRFPFVVVAIWGKITENARNGSHYDTLVLQVDVVYEELVTKLSV